LLPFVFQAKANELSTKWQVIQNELDREKSERTSETQLLATQLAEKTETVKDLSIQLQDKIGEIQLLKKKHAASVKVRNTSVLFRRYQ